MIKVILSVAISVLIFIAGCSLILPAVVENDKEGFPVFDLKIEKLIDEKEFPNEKLVRYISAIWEARKGLRSANQQGMLEPMYFAYKMIEYECSLVKIKVAFEMRGLFIDVGSVIDETQKRN